MKPLMNDDDDDSVARKDTARSAATTLRADRGDPVECSHQHRFAALMLRRGTPKIHVGAERRRNDTLRAEKTKRSAPHRERNDAPPGTERPKRTRTGNGTAGARKRKETPPPQARNDNAPRRERPEPTRRRASGGASSFTRFFGPGFPVRLAPDLRRWRAVPRRAGAGLVGGAPANRVGGRAPEHPCRFVQSRSASRVTSGSRRSYQ